jgi:NDP-sugar pyrophosphorylase family protein
MPVAGEPIIRRIIMSLARQGVRDVVVNLHHRAESLTALLGDGSDLGVHVRYSWEQPVVLGSAGGPRQAVPIIGADAFLIVNGDTLTDVDVIALAAAHRSSGALVTMAVVPNSEYEKYGGVRLDDAGNVVGFTRPGAGSRNTWHFIGVQAAHASIFSALRPGEPRNTVGDLYDGFIRTNPGSVRAFCSQASFWDIGTAADYLRTSRALGGPEPVVGRNVQLDPTANIDGSILWDDVVVGARATLCECIVADGARVPAGSSYSRSILLWRDNQLAVAPIGN